MSGSCFMTKSSESLLSKSEKLNLVCDNYEITVRAELKLSYVSVLLRSCSIPLPIRFEL